MDVLSPGGSASGYQKTGGGQSYMQAIREMFLRRHPSHRWILIDAIDLSYEAPNRMLVIMQCGTKCDRQIWEFPNMRRSDFEHAVETLRRHNGEEILGLITMLPRFVRFEFIGGGRWGMWGKPIGESNA